MRYRRYPATSGLVERVQPRFTLLALLPETAREVGAAGAVVSERSGVAIVANCALEMAVLMEALGRYSAGIIPCAFSSMIAWAMPVLMSSATVPMPPASVRAVTTAATAASLPRVKELIAWMETSRSCCGCDVLASVGLEGGGVWVKLNPKKASSTRLALWMLSGEKTPALLDAMYCTTRLVAKLTMAGGMVGCTTRCRGMAALKLTSLEPPRCSSLASLAPTEADLVATIITEPS